MTTRKICVTCGAEFGPDQKFCPNDGSALRVESTDDPLIGQVIGERYHITGLIGEGGMGRVYVAEHVRMGRRSAVKVMSPALARTADAITRFNREASNASRINHPNVAAIYDFGETSDGLLYIAMEFVEGETLHSLVTRSGPVPIARAAQITKGVADALAAAHHLGIIHRDLKPDNIMLARQVDGSDWVKVVDFGIAKSVATPGQEGGGQTVTTAGVSLGTPEYMSPEQLAGERLDARTDIYSLGLVLFNMLTGDLPYPKLTSKETLVKRLTSGPATLAQVRPDVHWPPALQAVLNRALDPEPARRYENVADLGRAAVAASAGADDPDPDRTVRVSTAERVAPPALAATAAHVPAAAIRPSAPTRRVEPAPAPRRKGGWLVVAGILLVAGGAYVLTHTPSRASTETAAAKLPPVAAESGLALASHDSQVSAVHAADTTAARSPAGASADTRPRTPQSAAASGEPKPTSAPVRDAQIATPAPPPPDSTRPSKPRGVIFVPAPHPWLRANGDSVPTANPIAAHRPEDAMAEIRGHMHRAGRAIALGQAVQAEGEMHSAQEEIRTLRKAMSGAPMPPFLQRQFRELPAEVDRACYATAGGDMTGNQRCLNFQQRQARGRASGRGGG